MNAWRIAAGLWAFAVLGCVTVLVWNIHKGFRYESELMSLLPGDAARPIATRAINRMAESSGKGALLLVGSEDAALAENAADTCAAKLRGVVGIANVVSEIDASQAELARQFYLRFRYGLLTTAQRERFETSTDSELAQRALEQIYSPLTLPRLAPLESDPLGLFGEALLDTASKGALTLSNKHLVVYDGARTWVVVLVDLVESGISMGERKMTLAAFDEAESAAKMLSAKTLRAGFIFHAGLAAQQAQHEMSTIGAGSLVGIVLLVLFTFRSLKPLLLLVLPIAVGSVTALGLSQLLFPKLHLITFVFGTSIIGVAVDYSLIFVAGRMAEGVWDAEKRRAEIVPVLSMALATSILAYTVLVALPFPVLQQMGVFTILGLFAAYLTALLWLPFLGRNLPLIDGSRRRMVYRAYARWPRIDNHRAIQLGLLLLAIGAVGGALRMRTNDDVRGLYAAAPELVRQQEQVERLMHLPAAGQFFLVTGAYAEDVLQRDEALTEKLEALKAKGVINGYESPARYAPSTRSQSVARSLLAKRIYEAGGIADLLFGQLDQPETAAQAKTEFERDKNFLTPEVWMASPISVPFRSLWLGALDGGGFADVVTVSGVRDEGGFSQLAAIADPAEGVEWVNHLRSLSELLGSFRRKIGALMIVGYAVVVALLFVRYRSQAWRVFTPAFLAVLMTTGLFGWMQINLNLFCVFGLLLSLDMGIDYGIYVQDRRSGTAEVAFLGAALSGVTTMLSFGLLALSQTPALRTFGLSVFLSIAGSLLLAPVFAVKHKA